MVFFKEKVYVGRLRGRCVLDIFGRRLRVLYNDFISVRFGL